MDLLIDTHVFIWFDGELPELRRDVNSVLRDRLNRVRVSAATVWEIAIKRRLGKLPFAKSVAEAIRLNGFEALDITPEDAERAGDLDWRHTDPFDRLLIAQARGRGLTLVTADAEIRAFPGALSLMPA